MFRCHKTARFCVLEREKEDPLMPRVKLRHVRSPQALELLRRHGYLIVTSLGAELESRLEKFCAAMTTWFHLPSTIKAERVGGTYVSERGVPMFRCGYEMQDRIRECFRVALGDARPLFPDDDIIATTWRKALVPVRRIADSVLAAALNKRSLVRPYATDDFSIAYAFYYPNTDAFGLDEDGTLVGSHTDPSLVV